MSVKQPNLRKLNTSDRILTQVQANVEDALKTVVSGINGAIPKVAIIKDIKPNGTDGGTANAGSYITRTLNNLDDPFNITSLSNNTFTLDAGTYLIEAFAPAYSVGLNKFKIRNLTDSTDAVIGPNNYAGPAASGDRSSSSGLLQGIVNISATKTFCVQHRVTSTKTVNGFGTPVSYGDVEIYTTVKITKI